MPKPKKNVTKLPKGLPDCFFLKTLASKAELRKDTKLDFLLELSKFRARVSAEIRYINLLFPEYTPHDEEYHLSRLFHITETILGQKLIESMNASELLVLACGIYGHDWGMAVNENEKEYIVTGKLPDGIKAEELWVLPDEHSRVKKFAKEQGLKLNDNGILENISPEMWREYVRQTHPYRSGNRTNRYFENIDGGLADATSRICVGHWLDIEELGEPKSYPSDYSVLRETVNLRALAVYVRLIDLMDFAEDRTPYLIWKYVAPRDPRSQMEWKKHRSLREVTCSGYLSGRVIRVDGSTDNHEVYAALEDMHNYCDSQLRGCLDLLARMKDPRHQLDIYHIEWRVEARGFDPVLIRFEFDRSRMFEILSDEIYQGDPYVFLRELLQNSIDAIRLRREVLKREGVFFEGVINVDVKHKENGDALITWTDNGIGMDEYIIRNYLSVAGRSYYQSSDFGREGFNLDPISKFGVGVLSCFMVADCIEIETYKEPNFSPPGQPLKIIIPDVKKQFRIEILPSEGKKVGTTFNIHIEGRKLPQGEKSKPLRVTEYISIIAGFVEFPIVINEGIRKTIVMHPFQSLEGVRKQFGNDYQIHQLNMSYPFDEVFYPQDLHNVTKAIRIHTIDIKTDLNLDDFEGCFALPVLNDAVNACILEDRSATIYSSDHDLSGSQFRWKKSADINEIPILKRFSKSANKNAYFSLYRDGILLSEVTPPNFTQRRYPNFPNSLLIINIPKAKSSRLNLARTQILDDSLQWSKRLRKAFLNYLLATELKGYDKWASEKLWLSLGRIGFYFRLEINELIEMLGLSSLPVIILGSNGKVKFKLKLDAQSDEILCTPKPIDQIFIDKLYNKYYGYDNMKILDKWIGSPSYLFHYSLNDNYDAGFRYMLRLNNHLLENITILDRVQFLKPPWNGNPPLLQEVRMTVKRKNELGLQIIDVCKKAFINPILLNKSERDYLSKILRLPSLTEFASPYDSFACYGFIYMNIAHSKIIKLIQLLSKLKLMYLDIDSSQKEKGEIQDMMVYDTTLLLKGEILNNILLFFQEKGLFNGVDISDILIIEKEFVPGTNIRIATFNV